MPQKNAPGDKIEAIYKNMDPLALVGVCIYKIVHDLTGFSLSEDTLLWFAAAATAIRTWITKVYSERIERRRREEDHRRFLELAEANAKAVEAASEVQQAARDLRQQVLAPNPRQSMPTVRNSGDSCQ